ncbi:MAG: DUF6266 family protein [Ginsengibacter sp.]
MAILSQGILGPVTGRTGPVVSYVRFGQNITRSLSNTKKNKIETPARKMQRQKIKVCNEFTKAFTGTGFFNKSFPAYGGTCSGYNRVTSAIMNLAIIGSFPDIGISYPQVLISKGPLPAAEKASATTNSEGKIVFTWEINTDIGTAKENDKVILVAYFPAIKKAVFSTGAAWRKSGQALLGTGETLGEIAETWLGFLSNDEKNASVSVYCGRVIA